MAGPAPINFLRPKRIFAVSRVARPLRYCSSGASILAAHRLRTLLEGTGRPSTKVWVTRKLSTEPTHVKTDGLADSGEARPSSAINRKTKIKELEGNLIS